MTGRGEQRADLRLLHQLALVHDGHAVRQVRHHAHVVGDQEDRYPELVAGAAQQVEDLGLDGDVEGGGGLVRDDDLGFEHERHRDHHALLLPAGELVGVVVDPLLGVGDAHPAQDVDRLGTGLPPGVLPVGTQALGDLPADRVDRVECGGRLLEDHGRVGAAHGAQLGARQRGDVGAVQEDRPGDGRGLGEHPEDGLGGHGLAAAALAHDGEHLARAHRQADAVDGGDVAAVGGEADAQVPHFDDVAHASPSCPAGPRLPPGTTTVSAVGEGAASARRLVRRRGSARSLRDSPMRVMPMTTRTIARPGKSPVHQMPLVTSEIALLRS